MAQLRVAVLFGGRSSEHSVSCATAAGVLEALDRGKYEVVPVGITREGKWTLAPDDPARYRFGADGSLPEVADSGDEVLPPSHSGTRDWRVLRGGEGDSGAVVESLGPIDVVFPLLHGPYGEDGTVQGVFELVDQRYVGAGLLASAVSMDKEFMKHVLGAAGLPVGPFTTVTDRQWRTDPDGARRRIAELGFPVFVKPARAGSSMGISKVDSPEGLEAAIGEARRHDLKLVVEAGIVGREIECAVLGHAEGARASLPGEIAVESAEADFYDFDTKYVHAENATLSCPASMPEEDREELRRMAVRVFEAVEAEGLSRVDFFYTPAGELIVNEINTLPGFTPHSMYSRMWEASGIPYGQLLDELIGLALDRPLGLR